MKHTKILAVSAICAASFASSSYATTYPTFVIDEAASSITLTQASIGTAELYADFSAGVDGYSWTPTSATDSVVIDELIDWSTTGTGLGRYEVEVTLAFSSPDAASGTASGGGFYASLFGVVSGGNVLWDGISTVDFAQGSSIDFEMEGGFAVAIGGVTSGVTLYGNEIAPIPLPAAGLLLLSALGGMAVVGRRRKKIAV